MDILLGEKRPDPIDLNGSWVGAQLPWSVGDVVLGRSSSGSSNLRSDLGQIRRGGFAGNKACCIFLSGQLFCLLLSPVLSYSTACSPLETYGIWSGLLWVKAGPGTCQACFAS
ncbi:unnamed protein product [Brassica oleracea]